MYDMVTVILNLQEEKNNENVNDIRSWLYPNASV